LFARKEGMTCRTDFNVEILPGGGHGLDNVAARAANANFLHCRVNFFLHRCSSKVAALLAYLWEAFKGIFAKFQGVEGTPKNPKKPRNKY